jgi:phage-related protein
MAGKGATLALKITGDASDAKRALDDTESSAGRFGGTMGKMGLAAAAGIGAAVVGLKSLYDAADESRKIGALTAQVIKSTGGAAGVSAQQVGDLAGAIAAKTGVDDEAIQSGQNLLLTFTNVKNGVGAGNDIFNQATKTMTDMSVALGTDASASAIQLGKALNDPVKGVSALQKVGVSFTADQKEQIKTLVASGNTMGAQKVILNELGKEFGGAAEAAATPLGKLQQRAGDVAEKLGGFLLPIVDKAATWFMDKLMPAVTSLWNELGPKLLPIIQTVGAVFTDKLIPAITSLWNELGPKLLPIIQTVAGFVTGFLLPAFSQTWDFISTYVVPIIKKILGPALEGIGSAFKTVTAKIMEHKDTFVGLYESLKPFLDFIRDKVAPFIGGYFKTAFTLVGKEIGIVVDVIAFLIDKLKWILDKGAAVGKFIGGLFGSGHQATGGALRGSPLMGAAPGGGAPFRAAGSIGGGGAGPSAAAGGFLIPVGDTYQITVTGALDPDAVAEQIARLLDQRARRIGAAPAFGAAR